MVSKLGCLQGWKIELIGLWALLLPMLRGLKLRACVRIAAVEGFSSVVPWPPVVSQK